MRKKDSARLQFQPPAPLPDGHGPRFFDFQLLHQVCFEHLTDNLVILAGASCARRERSIRETDQADQSGDKPRPRWSALFDQVPRLIFSNHRILPIFSRSEISVGYGEALQYVSSNFYLGMY